MIQIVGFMAFWKPSVKSFIEKNDLEGLDDLLSSNPYLANEGVSIPFEFFCRTKAHPLHRICDPVFTKKITDQDALKLAKVLIRHGSRIEGNKNTNQEDPPLLAAASLHAEQVAIYLLELGADPHVIHSDGSSALHWATFCGRDKLVSTLISKGVDIDQKDFEHQGTAIKWAIHWLTIQDTENKGNQMECIRLLLAAGADIKGLDQVSKNLISPLLRTP